MLLDIILAQWRRPVASSEALDLLHWEICAVPYRCIAMAIKTACFLGVFVGKVSRAQLWTSIKTRNFVTFYEFLIHLDVHHTRPQR